MSVAVRMPATPNAKNLTNDLYRGENVSPMTSRPAYHKNNGSIADVLHYSVNDPRDKSRFTDP